MTTDTALGIVKSINDPAEQEEDVSQGRSTKIEKIEAAMRRKYEYRYNTIKCQPEFRSDNERWKPMSKLMVNDLRRYLDRIGISTSTSTIKEILSSSFCEPTNPIREYIINQPEWNPKKPDYIKQMSDCIDTGIDDFEWVFKKWYVGMIANVMNDHGCQNELCLVFAGEQGVYKSTFFRNLLPPELSSYVFLGKPKDTSDERAWSQYLSEFMIICMDDCLKGILRKDNESIKSYITQSHIKFRRMYDEFFSEPPRIASFAATVNGDDILNDSTGSRRFPTFEIKSIDKDRYLKIDKSAAMAQALTLYKSGYQYWLSPGEQEIVERNNQSHTLVTIEEQFINTYCMADDRCHMQSAEIAAKLQEITRINYLSAVRIGEALKKLGYRRYQKTIQANRVWGWNVEITSEGNARTTL